MEPSVIPRESVVMNRTEVETRRVALLFVMTIGLCVPFALGKAQPRMTPDTSVERKRPGGPSAVDDPMIAASEGTVRRDENLIDQVRPLSAGYRIHRHVVGRGGPASRGGDALPRIPSGQLPLGGEGGVDPPTSRLAYSNTLGKWVFGPAAADAGRRIADDIVTTAAPGCNLDRYVIMVSGDKDGDGSGVGPFAVDVGLYEICPGASSEPVAIEGTSAHVELPDSGTYLVVLLIPPDVDIPIPSSLYLALSFSRENVGVAIGAPATVGFSVDRFDYPGFPCAAGLGGFSQFPHASFYAQIYVRDECPTSFPGYINSNQGGRSFSAGASVLFADEIRLAVDECNLIGYQIAYKGNGIIQADLKTELSTSDPENGGLIPDSRTHFFSFGDNVQVGSKFFDPFLLEPTQPLWIAIKTNSSGVGPVLTCKPTQLGTTANEYMVYDVGRGAWTAVEGDERCWLGFDVTLFCEGTPPIGACCDMILTKDACSGGPNAGDPCSQWYDCRVCVGGPNDGNPCRFDSHCPEGDCPVAATCAGDSVCRELPEMNCPSSWVGGLSGLWTEGGRCEPVCVGGGNAGEHCTVDADCTVCVEGSRNDLPCCPQGVCNDETGQCEGGDRDESTCCPDGACTPGVCEGSFCVGGDNDALACSVQADCPGGDCPGPFAHPCGVAACCKPDDTCENLTGEECSAVEPVELPHQWQLGSFCNESRQRCPFSACGLYSGDCLIPHAEPGCTNPFCCSPVCLADPFCCHVEWDRECVSEVPLFCRISPLNDECFDTRGDYGALEVAAKSSTVSDGVHATESVTDPGFCCHNETPGETGYGTVWYKFVATRTSAELDTLLSDPPADDALIQVFAAEDASTDETACNSLIPIACADDSVGERDTETNPEICVDDLIPGETYYVLVAAKTPSTIGSYRLTIRSPCPGSPPPNDLCADAAPLTDGLTPFDLANSTVDCPIDDCTGMLRRDVWYDYVATCDGIVRLGTCAPSWDFVYAGLVVYDGCDCPPRADAAVACGEVRCCTCYEREPISFEATAGRCYKIRLGKDRGGDILDAGDLRVECLPDCPEEWIEWLDPPDCVVDARRPHPAYSPEDWEGIDTILVEASAGAAKPECWTLSETKVIGFPNSIADVVDNEDGTVSLHLERPITPGAITEITYTRRDGRRSNVLFRSHPGNVDGNEIAYYTDVSAFIAVINGTATVRWGEYGTDCDHSGNTTPADLLCVIDLLNGAGAYSPGWNGTMRPRDSELCPY